MFDELKATIRHDVTHTVFRVSRARDEPARAAAPRDRGAIENRAAAPTPWPPGDGSRRHERRRQRRPSASPAARQRAGPKIGRNDPCWCGSGKKYKRCHGA